MKGKYPVIFLICILYIFYFSSLGLGLEIQGSEKILIYADQIEFNQKCERIQAKGNIHVHYQNTYFTSDEIDFLVPEETLWALGNIRLAADSLYKIQGDTLRFNTRSHLWNIENTQIFFAPSYYFTAQNAEQKSKKEILISQVSYTACDPADPPWELSCSRGTIDLDGSAKLKNIVLRIKNKPVFFFPYLSFPINQERAPGFLTPDFGRSSVLGIFLENTLYWPIREWSDLKFPIDYYEKKGIGTGVEYRYALTNQDFGRLRAYGLKDRHQKKSRGDFSFHFQQNLPLKTRGIADVSVVSDNEYYQDFQQGIAKRYSNLLESKAFLEKNTDPWNGRILTNYVKPLRDEHNVRYLKAPEITFYTKLRSYAHLPVFFRWDSSWTHFQIHDHEAYQGDSKTQRIDLFPQIFYSHPGRFLSLSSSLSHRRTYYRCQEEKKTILRNLYGGSLDITGPKFYQIFSGQWKHIWYPQISWVYETLDQEEKEIKEIRGIDSLDRLRAGRKINFSLINRVWQKRSVGKSIQNSEWLNLIIRQKYSFRKDVSSCRETQTCPGFTDFEIEASSKPWKNNQYTLNYIYDTDRGRLELTDFQCSIGSMSSFVFDLGWRYSRVCDTTWIYAPAKTSEMKKDQELNFLHSSLRAPFYNRWIGEVGLYYDIKDGSSVENQYTLTYRGACWSAQLTYVYRFNGQRWNVKINLDSLGGLNF